MAAPRSVLETELEKEKSKLSWSGPKRAVVGVLGLLMAIAGLGLMLYGIQDEVDGGGEDTGYRDREPTRPTSKCMPGHDPCGSRCCLSGWHCCGDGRCAPSGWC